MYIFDSMASNHTEKHWTAELLWWIITVITSILVLWPLSVYEVPFPFMWYNLLYIIVGLTWCRYLVFFDSHPLAFSRIFKVVLIFLVPIIYFPLLEGIHSFLEFNDREGLQSILTHLPLKKQTWLIRYIRTEYLFFSFMSFLGSLLLIIKMIKAFWRQYKYNSL